MPDLTAAAQGILPWGLCKVGKDAPRSVGAPAKFGGNAQAVRSPRPWREVPQRSDLRDVVADGGRGSPTPGRSS